jgi:hypothetical protein
MDNKLSLFGELLIKSVRDNSLFVLEGVISGHMKSQIDKEMHEKIKKMSKEDIDTLRDMAYRMVDLSLHNLLFMFEDNLSWKISNEADGIENLNELSDGLSGELYTSDGWIINFSDYPLSKGL